MTSANAVSAPAAVVIDELLRRGFRSIAYEEHVVLVRDALRVVLPHRDRNIPARILEVIEFGLEPHLGAGWLTQPGRSQPRPGQQVVVGSRTVYVLGAFVTQDSPDEPWWAFLEDAFTVVGFGDEREAALRDLKRAAACWMDVDVDDIALMTPTIT